MIDAVIYACLLSQVEQEIAGLSDGVHHWP